MAPVVDKKVKLSPLAFSGIAFVIIAALGFSSKGVLIKLAYALDPLIDTSFNTVHNWRIFPQNFMQSVWQWRCSAQSSPPF